MWAGFGLAVSGFIVLIESLIREVYPKTLLVGVLGLWIGLITATLVSKAVPETSYIPEAQRITYAVAMHLFLGYLGAVIALRFVERIDLSSSHLITADDPRLKGCKILDTSVLIDGRLLDMVKTGFLDGIYILPKFVLDELQNIADSPDPSRRQRGRRGLDTVRALKDTDMIMEISEKDYPHIQAVDAKLIQCAKDLEGRIVTNDFNLNKVAEINNIPVLNINDLSNALKPVILPGETLTLTLLKSGKEPGQGIGYLDDGTMVVVEDGIARLRDEVDVTVTSMLQTQAGRMIFGRLADSEEAPRRERESEESDRKESARKVVDLELKKK
ncbi:MAG: TRAM domain-containing protein [Candidatus Omnitrophica bacterium]|nr:TRAM domain-containing protein [Candidatus Omnitrophota bacterium]